MSERRLIREVVGWSEFRAGSERQCYWLSIESAAAQVRAFEAKYGAGDWARR
jgi:hypothetical protein